MFVETKVQQNQMYSLCEKASILGVDTETTGLDWKAHKLMGICLYPDGHKEGFFMAAPRPKDALRLSKLLAGQSTKILHNAKFDRHFLKSAGYNLGGRVYDTYILAKLWDENRANHKLKDLAVELVDKNAAETQDKLKEWLDQNKKTMNDLASVPAAILAKYGANDPLITVKLYHVLRGKLKADGIPDELVEQEMDVLDLAWQMERKGILVDKPFLERYQKKLITDQNVLLKKLLPHVPPDRRKDFNPESGPQVIEILKALGWKGNAQEVQAKRAGLLGIPAGTMQIGKLNDSADKQALKSFEHPFSKLLLEHRRLGTIRGTFVEGILTRARSTKEGWTVHCNYNVAGATTGRWSSNDPNLQNVDKKSDARKAFTPRPKTRLWLFDYKQIEPVLFAHYSGSQRLQKAFQDGLDYHSLNAAAAFGIPYSKVDPEGKERKIAKALGLAILYQAGKDKAAQMMGVSVEEGARIRENYFREFPEVKTFQKEVTNVIEQRAVDLAKGAGRLVIKGRNEWVYDGKTLPLRQVREWTFVDKSSIEEIGWIKNVFGRRRRLTIDEAYKGLNALIQGTAADLFKKAMVRTAAIGLPLLQVHDELGFELDTRTELARARKIKAAMESLQEFFPKVPIKVDVAVCDKNWMQEKGAKL